MGRLILWLLGYESMSESFSADEEAHKRVFHWMAWLQSNLVSCVARKSHDCYLVFPADIYNIFRAENGGCFGTCFRKPR